MALLMVWWPMVSCVSDSPSKVMPSHSITHTQCQAGTLGPSHSLHSWPLPLPSKASRDSVINQSLSSLLEDKEGTVTECKPFMSHFRLKACPGWWQTWAAPVCWINSAICETRTVESIWVTADFSALTEFIATSSMPRNLLGTATEKQHTDLCGFVRGIVKPLEKMLSRFYLSLGESHICNFQKEVT